MSQATYTTAVPGSTITAANANAVFEAVEDATDGTAGRIDPDNTRTGAITQQHLESGAVFKNHNAQDVGSVTTGTVQSSGTSGAATSWVQIGEIAITGQPTLATEEAVLRWCFNPMIGDVTSSGGSIFKAQQVYYLKVALRYDDGAGAVETDITPPFGYGLAQRSSNDSTTTGSEGDIVSAWVRNPLSGIIVNRTADREYISLRLYFRFNVNDNLTTANTVETCHVHSYCFAEYL